MMSLPGERWVSWPVWADCKTGFLRGNLSLSPDMSPRAWSLSLRQSCLYHWVSCVRNLKLLSLFVWFFLSHYIRSDNLCWIRHGISSCFSSKFRLSVCKHTHSTLRHEMRRCPIKYDSLGHVLSNKVTHRLSDVPADAQAQRENESPIILTVRWHVEQCYNRSRCIVTDQDDQDVSEGPV